MKRLASKDNRIYRFVQTNEPGNILNSVTGVASGATKTWSSADINQFSSFAAVFDQYKIEAVEVWITPYGPASAPGYNPTANAVQYCSVIDYDDANNFTTLAQAMQYQNCTTTSCQQGHYKRFRPHIAVGAYTGSVFTGFQNKDADWIDSATTAVVHYGIKIVVSPTTSNQDAKFDVTTRVHVAFRNLF